MAFQNEQNGKFNVSKVCGIQLAHLAKQSSMAFKVIDGTVGNCQLLSFAVTERSWTECTFVRSQKCVCQLLQDWGVALSQRNATASC